jgi:RNA polymerase sigma factor (sigma-70 family)
MIDGKLTTDDLPRIFEEYHPIVYRRALRLLGSPSDAEDAMQEIFIRAFRAVDRFTGDSPAAWLCTITTNHCLSRMRDRGRRRELDEAYAPEDPVSLVQPSQLILLRHLLSIADEELARAAVCVYLEGMSHSEAAEALGVSKRTVGNHIDRFLAFAKAQLASSAELPARGVSSLPRRRTE